MPNLIYIVPSLREKWGNLQRSTKSLTKNVKEGFLSPFQPLNPGISCKKKGRGEKGKKSSRQPALTFQAFFGFGHSSRPSNGFSSYFPPTS